jgi:hypothetical protein
VSQQDEATQEQQDEESRGEDDDNDGSVVSYFWHYFDSGLDQNDDNDHDNGIPQLVSPSNVLIDWNEQLQLVTLGDESWGSNTSRTATTTTAPIPPRRRLVPTPSKPQSTVKSNKKKRITVNSNNSDKT